MIIAFDLDRLWVLLPKKKVKKITLYIPKNDLAYFRQSLRLVWWTFRTHWRICGPMFSLSVWQFPKCAAASPRSFKCITKHGGVFRPRGKFWRQLQDTSHCSFHKRKCSTSIKSTRAQYIPERVCGMGQRYGRLQNYNNYT